MAVDLHTHSTMSDGSFTPSELVVEAAEIGLSAMALTDHDTLEGVAEAAEVAATVGLRLIPGVELSLEWAPGTLHVVILYVDTDSELAERLALLRAGRDDRNLIILQRLEELGISIEPDELLEKAGKGAVGRPHIAAILMDRGHVESIALAFDMYLARGRPAYVDRARLPPEDAFRLAREGGGVPILAHPHTLGLDRATQIADALDWLKSIGLVGIEAHYGGYDGFHRSGMVALAEKFGLVPSGGSDFHGTYKPETLLGTGSRGIAIPDSVLDELDSVRP